MKVECYFCKRKMKKRLFGYVFYLPVGKKFLRLRERFIKVVHWCKSCQGFIMAYETCIREVNKEHQKVNKEYWKGFNDCRASIRRKARSNESFEDFWARGGILGEENDE